MLTRQQFAAVFGPRPILGMVHLLPLPGAPLYKSFDEALEAALRDARALREGGASGIVFENFGDRPFTKARAEAETIAAMTRVIVEVRREVPLPFGVNVLRNDGLSALAIAAATGAAFVRVNVLTGAMVTDQGIIEGDAYAILRKRAALAPHVLLFADHLVKHATPLGDVDAVQAAKDLRHRGLADAIIISGAETGAAADPSRLTMLRQTLEDAPLLLGSGLTEANAHFFAEADGAIVGTSLKRDGVVDAARVGRIVQAFRR